MTEQRKPVRYGLFGLGGLVELGMGIILIVLYPGQPFMLFGIVLAVVGAVIFLLRLRGQRRARPDVD
jgi:hypothetical protein